MHRCCDENAIDNVSHESREVESGILSVNSIKFADFICLHSDSADVVRFNWQSVINGILLTLLFFCEFLSKGIWRAATLDN